MRRLLPAALLLLAAQGCALPSRTRPAAAPESAPQAAPASEPEQTQAPETQPAAAHGPDAPAGDQPTSPALAVEPPAGDDEIEGDEPDEHGAQRPAIFPHATPHIDLTDDEIADKAKHDLPSLGSISVGRPSGGLLVNGVQMPKGARWELIDPGHAWGTSESIDALVRAIDAVNEKFPDTHPMAIGHFSAKHGGHLSPHKSHQAGRDVDVGYYYKGKDHRWFAMANEGNLDLPRTWAFVRALVTTADIDMIFIDSSIQRLLAEHALSSGEEASFVDAVFQSRGKSPSPLVRHVHGHGTHIHVRFNSPNAVEMGRRAARFLPKPPPPQASAGGILAASAPAPAGTHIVMHRARSGDVLVNLAKQYGTTPEAIAQMNGLRGNSLKIGQFYKIPAAGPAKPQGKPQPAAQAGRAAPAAKQPAAASAGQQAKAPLPSLPPPAAAGNARKPQGPAAGKGATGSARKS